MHFRTPYNPENVSVEAYDPVNNWSIAPDLLEFKFISNQYNYNYEQSTIDLEKLLIETMKYTNSRFTQSQSRKSGKKIF